MPQYFEIDHGRILPLSFQFIIHCSYFRCYITVMLAVSLLTHTDTFRQDKVAAF
jgi:hypothetical protein